MQARSASGGTGSERGARAVGDGKEHERTDKALTVTIVSRKVFFGSSWESVKIYLTVGSQAIIASQ